MRDNITKQSKVSMVIPCYNKEKYIANMFNSILAQEWDNIELILVNDGSTDGTREIITEYEIKFASRGYEVTIIDQENRGLAGAVYSGLLCITGDYVCQVDSDDELDPRYVSMLAGWLDENHEYDWAVCDTVMVRNGEMAYQSAFPNGASDAYDIRKYLLAKIFRGICTYLIRASYFNYCGILERFYVGREANQESQIYTPLVLGGGKVKYFKQPLYKWNRDLEGNPTNHFSYVGSYEDAKRFWLSHINARSNVMHTMPLCDTDKQKYIAIIEIHYTGMIVLNALHYNCSNGYDEALGIYMDKLTKYFLFDDELGAIQEIVEENFLLVNAAVEDTILGFKQSGMKIPLGRVIAWGAMGKYGKLVINLLKETSFEPTELWDVLGDGKSIKKPDIKSLTPDDTVLILTQYERNTAGIICETKDTGCQIITSSEILTYLASSRFPQMYDGSMKFIYE